MADYKSESVAFLRELVAQTGKTPTELARMAGVSQTTLTRPLNSATHKYAVKFQTLQKLAEKTGIALPETLVAARQEAKGPAPAERVLAIRYEVAAGGFLSRDELPQQPYGYHRVPNIPPWEHNVQWLERVVSDSMNRLIPEGTLIQVVDAIDVQYRPAQNDIVVVERRSGQGAMVERTVKQVHLTPDGPELWPRSYNPRWSKPIALGDGREDEEDLKALVVGLVIQAYLFDPPGATVEEFDGGNLSI